MGEPNNALKVYISRPDRIKSVLEYYLGERLPEDWECREAKGFVAVRNNKGKKMDSDLKYVLGIMKCTSSPRRYGKYIYDNREYFSKIPRSAMDVIDVYTNIGDVRKYLKYESGTESGEEEANLCKALEEMKKQAMKHGEKRGERRGERRGTLRTLFSLVDDGCLVVSEAAKRASLSEADFCSAMKRAGYGKRQ